MNTAYPLDLALRAGLVALMLFAAALVLRDHGRSLTARLAAALAIGVAAYAVQSASGFAAPPAWWQAPIAALSTGNVVVFWLFSRALFEEGFRWRPAYGALWAAMALAGLLGCYTVLPMGWVITLGTLGFAILALLQSLSSWRADLVEKRRRLRIFIVGAGALYTVANMAPRLLAGGAVGARAGLAELLALSAIAVVVAWHLVRASGASLFQLPPPAPQGLLAEDSHTADLVPDPSHAPLIAALQRLMTTERAYRQEALTIGALARQLAVPEYKLRRAINQGLGYRNFNAFLNRYRLEEVKAALADPAQAPVPVLTLALDAGFQSIGPFNRAFKAETGITPTEFRRTKIA